MGGLNMGEDHYETKWINLFDKFVQSVSPTIFNPVLIQLLADI